MELYYNGTDITGMVQVNSCVVRDAVRRSDSAEIKFGNAAGWYSWGPQEDDQILVAYNGYDSGILYVNRIVPENGNFRIIASSLPCKARAKKSASYRNMTIEEIIRANAMASGMDYQLFGVDGGIVIPYIERDDEGAAAFLNRFLMFEGAVLKCVNGKFSAIGIEYAQDIEASRTVCLRAKRDGMRYMRDGVVYRSVSVKTPYASGLAVDSSIPANYTSLTVNCLPVTNDLQAKRWAKGKLLHLNQKSEIVVMQDVFRPEITAMIRLDVEGDTDATGEWIVESVEHDFIYLTTEITLRRCIRTIQ